MQKKKISPFKKKLRGFKKKLSRFSNHIIILFVIGIVIGSVHGLYSNYVRESQHQYYYGTDLCNGDIISGDIIVQPSDSSIRLLYRVIIDKGTVNLRLYDPEGRLFLEFNEWESIQRQKSIKTEKHGYGKYSFSLSCEKADIEYELRFEVG